MIHRTGTELINPFKVLERVGIRERVHIADIGCGAIGHFVFPAAQLVGAKGKVYAVDILKDVLDILERRAKEDQYTNISYVWSDMDVYHATRIPEESLDIALLANSLPHSQEPTHLVKELARLVKKGGKVLVIDWDPEASTGPSAEHRLSPADVKELFQVPEFQHDDTFDAGRAHYALLFRRTDKAHAAPNDIKSKR